MRKNLLILFCVAWSATTIIADDNQINVAHPDWSPDGTQLAFAANWDGAQNIYVMNVDGSRVRQLTFGKAMDSYPRYAPDGKRLAFLSRRHPQFSMHFIRADGKNERALLPAVGNLEPAVSPNGRWVAYRSYLDGDDPDGEIMIVRVSGENPSRLTENNVEDGYPVFSVDGKELFFHRIIGEYRQIIKLDLESGTEIQLTLGDCNSWHAHPSPDGRSIVYDSDCGGNRDIYSLDFENHHVAQLTTDSSRDGYPKFSPDGQHIAFHSNRRGSTEIFIMAADGNEQTLLSPQPPPQK
jgi:TolB protein